MESRGIDPSIRHFYNLVETVGTYHNIKYVFGGGMVFKLHKSVSISFTGRPEKAYFRSASERDGSIMNYLSDNLKMRK